jgi:hypothetical protein
MWDVSGAAAPGGGGARFGVVSRRVVVSAVRRAESARARARATSES